MFFYEKHPLKGHSFSKQQKRGCFLILGEDQGKK